MPCLQEVRDYIRELISFSMDTKKGRELLELMPDLIHDWYRHTRSRDTNRQVFFNDAVQIRRYRFTAWERSWRQWRPGRTDHCYSAMAARYDTTRIATGSTFRASARQPQRLRKIKWLGDTGATWHMIGRNSLLSHQNKNITHGDPVRLATANGSITTNLRVGVKPAKLSQNIAPLLVDKCPPILSVMYGE